MLVTIQDADPVCGLHLQTENVTFDRRRRSIEGEDGPGESRCPR